MALTLQLVYGSTTVDLTAGVYQPSYVPQDPGGRDTVTESLIVRILASNLADQQAAIRNITLAFEAGQRRRLTGIGDRLYVKFLEEGGTVTYRSEIWADQPRQMPGKVSIEPITMSKPIFDAFVAQIRVTWTRRGYWENNSETELELANGSRPFPDRRQHPRLSFRFYRPLVGLHRWPILRCEHSSGCRKSWLHLPPLHQLQVR